MSYRGFSNTIDLPRRHYLHNVNPIVIIQKSVLNRPFYRNPTNERAGKISIRTDRVCRYNERDGIYLESVDLTFPQKC